VYRKGGVSQEQYLGTVARFWAQVGVDPNGRQVVGTPGAVPAATPAPPAQVGSAADGPSMAEQLQRLGELKADGILTDEVFATAKRRLIGG
jgi:hypothetical protein